MEIFENLFQSLSSKFGSVLPGVLGAIVVLIIGFFIAGIVRRLVLRLMKKTTIDENIGARLNTNVNIGKFVAKLFYYLVVIYTLLVALNLLGVHSVLEPLQAMMTKFVGFLPNIIGAGVIGFAGYMISSLASEATGFLSERLENFGTKVGLNSGSINLTKIVKQVVFIVIFIPILIIALDTLKMDAISQPATEMLRSLLLAVPKIIAAIILLGVFYIIGKYVVSIVSELLRNLGLDNLSNNMGLGAVLGNTSLSSLIGNVGLFFIMFTGVIAAADKLELGQVQNILSNIFEIAGRVFFGMVIMAAGMFVSNLAVKALSNSSNGGYMIPIVRFAIVGIFLAFALHTMGIAESIVNLAFGLTLGSIAVAFALSFGLGGREAAGKQMDDFFKNIRKSK